MSVPSSWLLSYTVEGGGDASSGGAVVVVVVSSTWLVVVVVTEPGYLKRRGLVKKGRLDNYIIWLFG